jgi:hypothetical protein
VISLSAQNWADYAPLIDDEKIGAAERGLLKLIPVDELKGRRFLDIGWAPACPRWQRRGSA